MRNALAHSLFIAATKPPTGRQAAGRTQVNASRLIEANIKAHTVDGYTAFHMVAAAHERTIRALAAELAVLRGEGQTPQHGTTHAVMTLGDAEVLVEYELIAAEEPIYDADHPGVGPGHDAECNIMNVLINGVWCDAEDVIPAGTLQRWEEKLIDADAPAALRSVCPVPAFPSLRGAA